MFTPELIRRYPLISDQVDESEIRIILRELEQCLVAERPGAVVEFGCYIGTTSLFIQRLLAYYGRTGDFHVYDSFVGLPPKSSHDTSPAGMQFVPGELKATKKVFVTQFKKAALPLPVVHKDWFCDLGPEAIPQPIMFAFLDGDYYQSIKDSLRLITPQLAAEARIVVDDYANEALPGVAKAVDEWCRQHYARLRVEASLAIVGIV